MKLQFKHQKFQADAAKAVCDVFRGQPYLTPIYNIDMGTSPIQQQTTLTEIDKGWCNQPIQPYIAKTILENIQKVQRTNKIKPPSTELEGLYNLTIEMETGVGKTYTYIKTMYELHEKYGWSKFIIVVPSVAIREGVYKSFQITEDHFAEEYGNKIRYFIYKSTQLSNIEHFASNSGINVMIINFQAFTGRAAKNKDGRRIRKKLDEFNSRRPIDVIAKTNPILILDEPQSLDGPETVAALKDFKPLMTLRYSATHKENRQFNMIYRLDALEAYNKKLVKKIAVKGIAMSSTTATEGYLYLSAINVYKDKNPTATLEFECKYANFVKKVSRILKEKDDLYIKSNELEQYKDSYTILPIKAGNSYVEFTNGKKIYVGELVGEVNEEHLYRIQIRETILSHLERERQLFNQGIKVLSLFFIDEVAKYKVYDTTNKACNGDYASIFEEEYKSAIEDFYPKFNEDTYSKYLGKISVENTHKGYFSIDNKKRMINSKVNRKTKTSEDSDAYDLIMRAKERLLDTKEPVRFIFSHSALREGWDNPNVFQICTLKKSTSIMRKRQEVGRGLRLCVNQSGERMDENLLGDDVHNVNVLTVIASESYDSFARALQDELAKAIGDRPTIVDKNLFIDSMLNDINGNEIIVTDDMAQIIFEGLIANGYVKRGELTEKYDADKKNGTLSIDDEIKEFIPSIISILDTVFNKEKYNPENAREIKVTLKFNKDNFDKKEFQALWKKINIQSKYIIDFEDDELIEKSIEKINTINILPIYIEVSMGEMKDIKSKEELEQKRAFSTPKKKHIKKILASANNNVKYDLIGKLTEETGLIRSSIVRILKGIKAEIFGQFKYNPEEFIIKVARAINAEKAAAIIQHISYNKIDVQYDVNIFTAQTIQGKLGINAMSTDKHIFDFLLYDSKNECKFAEELESQQDVIVYAKLPKAFFISTPLGKYNPDWAIVFHAGNVKHIYFVAETKGSMDTMQLRLIENNKINCARKHFKAISNDSVKFDVVSNYTELLAKVMG